MEISKLLPGVKTNFLLKDYTTFKIGGLARYFFTASTKTDLIQAIKVAKKLNLPFFILGGGSNLLISDEGYSGLIIKTQNPKPKIQNSKVIAGAGVILQELIEASAKAGLSGLEWAVGIPGTVGGAIRGNAGAGGKSMKNIVKTVGVFNAKTEKIKNFKNKDCQFNYRESTFKKNKDLVILSAVLQLKKKDQKVIKTKINYYLSQRKQKQPLNFPSAGSIFKNPTGFSAGQLIEKCNLKGKRIGDAQISLKHANFIVNLGKASAKDVLTLIKLIKQKVKSKFGIDLEEEIQFLGNSEL